MDVLYGLCYFNTCLTVTPWTLWIVSAQVIRKGNCLLVARQDLLLGKLYNCIIVLFGLSLALF